MYGEYRACQADDSSHRGFDAEVAADENEEGDADVERKPQGAIEGGARFRKNNVEEDMVVYDEDLRQNAEEFERAFAGQSLFFHGALRGRVDRGKRRIGLRVASFGKPAKAYRRLCRAERSAAFRA
jgi:hypothetical protein